MFEEIDSFSKLIIIFKILKHKQSVPCKISFLNFFQSALIWPILTLFESIFFKVRDLVPNLTHFEIFFKVHNFSKCIVTQGPESTHCHFMANYHELTVDTSIVIDQMQVIKYLRQKCSNFPYVYGPIHGTNLFTMYLRSITLNLVD